MLVDENPQWKALGAEALGGTPVTMHLTCRDVDKSPRKAVAAGATVVCRSPTCSGAIATASWRIRSATLVDRHHAEADDAKPKSRKRRRRRCAAKARRLSRHSHTETQS